MRYIPLTKGDKDEMLRAVGASSIDELFSDIPMEYRLKKLLKTGAPMTEPEITRHIKNLAAQNRPATNGPTFLGAGSYNHFIPSAVDHITSRSEWYSAYTPYQPEISQGTLQAIYEFQSYVCALTAMEVSNASMYDGASAMAEAILMACRVAKKNEVVLSDLVHPRWRDVSKTLVRYHSGIRLTETVDHPHGRADVKSLASAITDDTAALVVQSPNFFGNIEDLLAIGELCREKKILFIVGVAEAMSLGMLKPPGECGADIVVAEGQSLGLHQSYGGPYLGLFATKSRYIRQMPGRLCGKTVDKDGRDGFVLTLAAREQHIRREKATSNICTNEALCALRATIYLSLTGKKGFTKVARASFDAGAALKTAVDKSPKVSSAFDLPFFNEKLVKVKKDASVLNRKLEKEGITGGLDVSRFYPSMKKMMLLATTENTMPDDIKKLMKVLGS